GAARVGGHVHNEHLVREQATSPDPRPVIREPPVVHFVAATAEVKLIDELGIVGRIDVHIDYPDEIIVHSIDGAAGHVQDLLGWFETLDERRNARFGPGR